MRAVVAENGLKRMLINNESSINITYGGSFNKMEVDHELTPMTYPLYGYTGEASSHEEKSL